MAYEKLPSSSEATGGHIKHKQCDLNPRQSPLEQRVECCIQLMMKFKQLDYHFIHTLPSELT